MNVVRAFQTSCLFICVLGAAGCAGVGSGESAKWGSEVDAIVEKVESAYDPEHKADRIKTVILTGVFRSNSGDKGDITLEVKAPNKFRLKISAEGVTSFVKAYDGRIGWEYSDKRGFRVIQGSELDELKLQAFLTVPCLDFGRVFSSIKKVGETNVVGKMCWKMVCEPTADFKSQPITIYIDKKTGLIAKTEEKQDTDEEVLDVSTLFRDYVTVDGVVMAMTIVSQVGDVMNEAVFDSLEVDTPLDDTAFDPPEAWSGAAKGGAK